MKVLECERTISAVLVAVLVAGMATGCKRTTAGTAGEGGNASASSASAAAIRPTGPSGAARPMDSTSRVDSAAGSVLVNPNGVAATSGTTSMFLPTLGTTVQVPALPPTPSNRTPGSGALNSGSATISPFIPIQPGTNPNFPDSNTVNRPPTSAMTNPLNAARPNSTLVRPMAPGSTIAVPRRPE